MVTVANEIAPYGTPQIKSKTKPDSVIVLE